MKRKLVIIGAGGHGKVCAEIAKLSGYSDIVFLDDEEKTDINVSGPSGTFIDFLSDSDFFVGIGDNAIRKKISDDIIDKGGDLVTLIHPSSIISETAKIETGSVIMAGSVINADARIGKGSIINTCSSVDHDCVIEEYSHISVGAHVAGTVVIGQRVFVGAGATVINNLSICDDCVIGAGAAVVKSINKPGVYVGVPAREHDLCDKL